MLEERKYDSSDNVSVWCVLNAILHIHVLIVLICSSAFFYYRINMG